MRVLETWQARVARTSRKQLARLPIPGLLSTRARLRFRAPRPILLYRSIRSLPSRPDLNLRTDRAAVRILAIARKSLVAAFPMTRAIAGKNLAGRRTLRHAETTGSLRGKIGHLRRMTDRLRVTIGHRRAMTDHHREMIGDHREITGRLRGMTGGHLGTTEGHRGTTEDHRGMTGDHREMNVRRLVRGPVRGREDESSRRTPGRRHPHWIRASS
jgi:hypothetical protein